jgi:hypothetical protein
VKNSAKTANVRGLGFHAVVAPRRGMTTQKEKLTTEGLGIAPSKHMGLLQIL